MTITATYQEDGSIFVVRQYQAEDEDGNPVLRTERKTVPDEPTNRDRQRLAQWEANGGVIAPYIPPTPPTDAELDGELMQRIQTVGTFERATLEALYDLATKPHNPDLTKRQFFNYFENKLRG